MHQVLLSSAITVQKFRSDRSDAHMEGHLEPTGRVVQPIQSLVNQQAEPWPVIGKALKQAKAACFDAKRAALYQEAPHSLGARRILRT